MAIENIDGALAFATGLDNSGLKTGITQGINMITNFKNKISKINPFVGVGIGAALAFGKALESATKFELEFRKLMTEVKTISDEVTENYGYFSDQLYNIAKETGESVNVLAKGLYQVISASFGAEEAISLLGIASKAAKAGISDTETSIDAITTVLNAWGLSADHAQEVSDIFFQTVKAGKTTFGEYGSQVAQVASIAADAGVSFADISEAVAELTKRGTPTAQALTQIRAGIVSVRETLGDAIFQTYNLREGFRLMAEASGNSFNKLKEDAGRIEAVNAILALTAGGVEKTQETYTKFMEELPGATEMAYSRVETITQSSWEKIGNIIMDAIRPLGVETVDWLEKFGNKILELLGKTDDVSSTINAAILKNVSSAKALFAVMESSTASDKAKAEALSRINSEYGKYLDNLLTEKTTQQELNEARKNVIAGVTAQVGIQETRQSITELINKYESEVNKLLDDIRSGIAEKTSSSVSSVFTTELNALIDEATSIPEGDQIAKIFPDESELLKIWDRYVDKSEYSFEKFKEVVNLIAQQRFSLNVEVDKLQKSMAEYEEVLLDFDAEPTKKKETTSDEGSNIFNFEEEAKKLDAIKKEFEKFALLQSDFSREHFIEQSEYLTSSLTEWEDYLVKRYEAAKDANEKLLIEMQASQDNIVLKQEPLQPLEPITDVLVKPRGVLEQIDDELSALRSKLEAETMEHEKNLILQQIEALETKRENWLKYKDDVNDIYKDLFKSIKDLRNKDLKDLLNKIDEAISKEKKGSENQIELLKRRAEVSDKIATNISETFAEIPGIFAQLSTLVTNIDTALGSSLGKMQGVVSAGAQLGASIATGNVLGMISGGLGVVNSLFSMFDNTARKQEEMARQAEIFRQKLELQNRTLERQLELMEATSGTQRIQAEVETLELINKQIEELNKAADEVSATFEKTERGGLFGWGKSTTTYYLRIFDTVEDLIAFVETAEGFFGKTADKYLDQGFEFKNADEIQNIIDAYDELIAKRKELMEEFLETDVSSISSGIREGLEEGMTFIDSFASTFEDAMKNAMMHAFELQYILPLAQEMFSRMEEMLSPTSKEKLEETYNLAKGGRNLFFNRRLKGKLDELGYSDYASFEDLYKDFLAGKVDAVYSEMADEIESAAAQWEAMQELLDRLGLGEDEADEDTLAGQITRAITEETGSELLGLWHVTSLDIRTIRDSFISLSNAIELSVSYLALISQNSEKIASNSELLSQILDELQDNSGNSNRAYGT